jgi:hypothetical protein
VTQILRLPMRRNFCSIAEQRDYKTFTLGLVYDDLKNSYNLKK